MAAGLLSAAFVAACGGLDSDPRALGGTEPIVFGAFEPPPPCFHRVADGPTYPYDCDAAEPAPPAPATVRALGIVAAGGPHTCVALADGGLACWGSGLSDRPDAPTVPRRVAAPAPVVALSASLDTCALSASGRVDCWDGKPEGAPVRVGGIEGATVLAASHGLHDCVVAGDGRVLCWGGNHSGELGDGTRTDRPDPRPVSGISAAVSVAVGGSHTCAVLSDGTVRCWGSPLGGRLGTGDSGAGTASCEVVGPARSPDQGCEGDDPAVPLPARVAGVTGAVAVGAGNGHSCALGGDGTVRCWGDNSFGQLGDGTTQSRPSPVAVAGLRDAAAISVGGIHTCALKRDGSVECWGNNAFGGLGDGTMRDSAAPVRVRGVEGAIAIAAGMRPHTCAVLSDGSVRCWGYNAHGQVGDGTRENRAEPVAVELPR